MLAKSRNSNNYSVLKRILSKARSTVLPHDAQYIIIYAFLYKYCSDSFKSHLMTFCGDRKITPEEALNNQQFKSEAYDSYGYFIDSTDAFFDEVAGKGFADTSFIRDFIERFTQSISFKENSNTEWYMKSIFERLRYDFDNQTIDDIAEIISSISKLDIFDFKFHYHEVFEAISNSNLLDVKSNPEYIYQILSAIIVSQKEDVSSIYDPFMGNGESFFSVLRDIGVWMTTNYGKEEDNLTYCYTITRILIDHYRLQSLHVENADARESIDINQSSFDGIMSVIPIEIRNYRTSNKNMSLEIAKRNRTAQLKDLLAQNFGMDIDVFTNDGEINSALEKLVSRMDVESQIDSQFMGEYSELNDSEFLFLINLIDSLKDDGVMAISISKNFLFKPSLKILRKYLTCEKNYIDAIINIPNDFGRYKRPEVVIVFRKHRTDDRILFIDMSRDFDTRHGRLMVPGMFRRNLLLSNDTIVRMVDALSKRMPIPKYCELICMAEISQNDFNLSVSTYVDTFEGEFIRLDQLAEEKRGIDKRCEDLSAKIDIMMKELNIKF